MGEPETSGRSVRLPTGVYQRLRPTPEGVVAAVDTMQSISELPGFAEDVYAQGQALVFVSVWWNLLTKETQTATRNRFAARVTRCRQSPDPGEMFRKIINLTREEDIRRAVMVSTKALEGFQTQENEAVYPTGGWLGDYLEYAKHNEVPMGFHFWSAVVALGAVCHRNIYVELGLDRLYLNSYVFLTGIQATGKSVAKNIAVDVLRRYNSVVSMFDPKSPALVNILPEDITGESLVSEMASAPKSKAGDEGPREIQWETDSTALAAIDELANFLSKDTWAVKKKTPLLTTLFGTDYYSKSTKKGGLEELRNVALSMVACCAPDWFRENITEDVRKGGLVDRIVFVHRTPTRRCYPVPPPLDPLYANDLAQRLRQWSEGLREKTIVRAQGSARLWYNDWYQEAWEEEQARGEADPTVRTTKRQSIYLWKLGSLLSMSAGEFPEITLERFKEAQRILRHETLCLSQLLEMVDERPEANVYDKLTRHVRDCGGCIRRSDLTQRFKRTIGSSVKIRGFLDTLIDDGSLLATRGRPTVFYLAGHQPCKECKEGRE